MSGGYFDYEQFRFNEIADELEDLVESNNDKTVNEWGDQVGREYDQKTINRFKTAHYLCRMAFAYAHRIDYLLSSDDSEEDFHERLEEDIVKVANEFEQFLKRNKNESL